MISKKSRPKDSIELGQIKSILENRSIIFFVKNEEAHIMSGAPPAICANEMRLFVQRDRALDAVTVLRDVLGLSVI